MKLNKEKCHFLVAGHKHELLWVNVGKNQIWESKSEKMLGVNVDSKLKFDAHVEYLIKSAGRKLTILARMCNILTFSKLRILIKSFFESQFSYCPLVWMFCSRALNNRINKLQERALRILYKDDISTFQQLLNKDKSVTIHIRNIQLLATEMYKAKNNILPCSLSESVTLREITYNLREKSDFQRYKPNTVYYGTETLSNLGPKIWQLVPNVIKESSTLSVFKSKIKNWITDECPCRLCKVFLRNVGFL